MGQANNAAIPANRVKYASIPYFIMVQPAALVPAGTTVQVEYTVGVRNFICTNLGFTSSPVGVPAQGQVFNLGLEDVGMSRQFQPDRWNTTAVFGSNPALQDKPAFPLPVAWTCRAHTTIRIEFENIGTLACLPTLVLVGYLGQMPT